MWFWWVVLVLTVFGIVGLIEWMEQVDARREADKRFEHWLEMSNIPFLCEDCWEGA